MSPPDLRRGKEKSKILEIKIISGSDISHSNVACKMDIYAVVSITGDNIEMKQGAKTPIDFYGGSNPTWNHTIQFSVNEEEARLNLKVKLFSYWLDGENDLFLGKVNVSVQDPTLANGNDDDKPKLGTYSVKTIGRSKGTLTLSYWFRPEAPVHDSAQEQASLAEPVTNGGPRFIDHGSKKFMGVPLPVTVTNSPPQLQTIMTKLTLKLVIKSAKGIKSVSIRNGMKVYASVIIREGKPTITNTIINTPIAHCIYSNPKWDHGLKFSLDEKSVREGRLTLIVKLIAVRSLLGDKELGEVTIPVKELFGLKPPSAPSSNGDDESGMSLMTRDVKVPDGKEGTLSFTYKFIVEQAPQPFIVYPIEGTSNYAIVQHGEQSHNNQLPLYIPQSQQQYSPPTQQPKPQGGSIAALGLGAAIAGRVIGGALME